MTKTDLKIEGATAYMDAIRTLLDDIARTQSEALDRAATALVNTVQNDRTIFIFGSGHSHMLAEEGHFRAGGLANVTPILIESLMLHQGSIRSTSIERVMGLAEGLLKTYNPVPGDTLIVFSNSGVNAVPVEMALAGKKAGLTVIAVLSREYAAAAQQGPVGMKLADVADILIDNHGVAGDAIVSVGEDGLRVSPTSTITGAFILNALVAEVAFRLHQQGQPLPIYVSANVPGAAEHNRDLFTHFRERNPHL
jgi:uncharacterized phosphosugar-binding protein